MNEEQNEVLTTEPVENVPAETAAPEPVEVPAEEPAPASTEAVVPAEEPAPEPEVIPSMDEFKEEISNSFRKLVPGDIVNGTVIGVSETEVTVDLGCYAEGIIKLEELSNDPRFSIKEDITVGEKITATVLREDKEGNILLSRKQADDVLAWETLKEMMANRSVATVKVAQTVNSGVVTYLNGIRAFIPASKLDINYVEDLSTYVGKELEVRVITVEEEKKKLVLSAKDVLLDKAAQEKKDRIANVPVGTVTTGTVEKIMPYGAFIALGNDLSGLVHVSQISTKRIKTPDEALKVGDEVKVKILGVKDGKISLSIKAAAEKEEPTETLDDGPRGYSSGGEAVTGLAALLKGIKLD